MNRECVTCKYLGNCATVDPQKVLAHFVCIHYKEVATPGEVDARCAVINKYGEVGLVALCSPDTTEEP